MRGQRELPRQNNLYQYERRNQDKQNIPLRMNYGSDNSKKFTYGPVQRRIPPSPQKSCVGNKDEQINRLRQELQEERQKVKHLQTTIIQEQSSVLEHLEMLELKFQQVTSEKNHLEVELHKLNNKNKKKQHQEQENRWKQKYHDLECQHKKVKKVANSMIDMMHKVDGADGDVHDAWKWVKKIVWEYQGIRKKALQWKSVYDQVTQAVNLNSAATER